MNSTSAIIAGTELGGFDTHKGQGGVTGNNANTHPQLNKTVGWSIYALQQFFKRYGRGGTQPLPGAKASWDDIVVVTLSEFGRTTIENSDLGTDHAEAGVMFVAGGLVKGYNKGNTYGVFNCGLSDLLPWVPGPYGSMFGVSGRYLQRCTDYRSVLGEVIRKHLGASPAQVGRIIPGYLTEPEIGGQRVVANSSVDRTPVLGEVGVL